jgi:sulfate adenylyltransferase subunit 1
MKDLPLAFVIVGHVDHGKSTLIGRLLFDTGSLPKERYLDVLQSSAQLGRETEFAYALDTFEEERRDGFTLDTAQFFFHTQKANYIIIDAPGHKELIKNMITGASYAQTAVLVIDAQQGIREQTKRHAFILKMLGLEDIIVVMNKMDLVEYSQEVFGRLETELFDQFSQESLSIRTVIPISALLGENVGSRSNLMAWYKGPFLIETLDSFEYHELSERPFTFPVQDVYSNNGRTILVGKIESGEISAGSKVNILPTNQMATIKEIMKYPEGKISKAMYGDSIGIVLDDSSTIRRGNILATSGIAKVTDTINATIFWFEDEYSQSDELIIRLTTQEAKCKIKVLEKFDPGEDLRIVFSPHSIMTGEAARVSIKTENFIAVESYTIVPELGRFVIEKKGRPVAGGIVT